VGHVIKVPTRRERQREQTYVDIVNAARELLAEGAELSLRAVAARMGMTAPALYRYVANYQELVDLVAFELDKAATEEFAVRAEAYPADDPAARLTAACVGFRRWALERPREFALVFANPIVDVDKTERREMLTVTTSGHYFTDLLYEVWQQTKHPIPSLDELEPAVRDAVLEPLIPAKFEHIPREDRGLLWLYMQSWSALYGVVTLESTGHCDPRVIAGASLFRATMLGRLAPHGLEDQRERLIEIMDKELALEA
jgi:AcrR family transcriptional regulator